ncbi:hypothetical protein A9Z07_03635 [Acinetobacter sp. YK3]|nr:hypothetical protein A9Z07_03635 [Acinetobacter sp. YK3]
MEFEAVSYGEKLQRVQDAVDMIAAELFYYEKLLNKYKPKNLEIRSDPFKIMDDLFDILSQLNGNILDKGVDVWKQDILKYLASDEAFKTLVHLKMIINSDIQSIILYYLDDKKGH